MAAPTLSIVAPAYNEERNLPAFLAAMIPVLEGIGETFEIIFVDDGSRDGTRGMLAAAASQDPRVKVVGLARNFGKDIALSAGLAHASGQAVIPIDCDLQHPPGLIPQFVAKWREGYDMVIGVRSKRDEEGFLRRNLSQLYYKIMRSMTSVEIPPNAGDFRLLDRKILDVINRMPERHRFMKGIFAWPGFKTAAIEFQANVRANDTRSSWSFFKLWRFALDGLFSFSTAPLKLWTYVGALSAGGAFVYLMITLVQKLFFGIAVPGYASLLIVLLFFNGLLLVSNGVQGEYIARIFEEVKGRPLYVVGQTIGLGEPAAATRAPAAAPGIIAAEPTAPAAAPPPPGRPPTLPPPVAASPFAPPPPGRPGTIPPPVAGPPYATPAPGRPGTIPPPVAGPPYATPAPSRPPTLPPPVVGPSAAPPPAGRPATSPPPVAPSPVAPPPVAPSPVAPRAASEPAAQKRELPKPNRPLPPPTRNS